MAQVGWCHVVSKSHFVLLHAFHTMYITLFTNVYTSRTLILVLTQYSVQYYFIITLWSPVLEVITQYSKY